MRNSVRSSLIDKDGGPTSNPCSDGWGVSLRKIRFCRIGLKTCGTHAFVLHKVISWSALATVPSEKFLVNSLSNVRKRCSVFSSSISVLLSGTNARREYYYQSRVQALD